MHTVQQSKNHVIIIFREKKYLLLMDSPYACLTGHSGAMKNKEEPEKATQVTVPHLTDQLAKWKESDPRRKKMDSAIIETIATDHQPFTAVSDVGFQQLMSLPEPHYHLHDEKFRNA